ncbi:MAG: hypothetical protein GF317_12060 [Candidatus Lokiarchaeota archaeon]|nr:hypothetical protein [Candidatus Lokiarchaeota archaeon]MBD3200378.1 hypothetical protein [Candidatus Lokiarchaeota archaeon]
MNDTTIVINLHKTAKECIRNEEYEDARLLLEKVLRLDPNNGYAMSDLCFVHFKLDFKYMNKKECWELIQKARDLKFSDFEKHTGIKIIMKLKNP